MLAIDNFNSGLFSRGYDAAVDISITAERLKAAMEQRGIDQPKLAEMAGCTQGAISQILLGKTRRSRYLPDIADALGVSVNWLRGDPGAAKDPHPPEPPSDDRVAHIIRIDAAFAAGPGTNLDDPIEETSFELDMGYLRSLTSSPPHRVRVGPCDGDSMIPTIWPNDLLIFDLNQNRLVLQDKIWACRIYKAGAVKRLRKVEGDRVQVISDNPDHENQIVDAADIEIIGRVVGSLRRH